MPTNKKHLIKELCLGCMGGIYLAIVLFAITVSLFFRSSFNGITLLNGYAVAMVVGGITGLMLVYVFFKIQGIQHDKQ